MLRTVSCNRAVLFLLLCCLSATLHAQPERLGGNDKFFQQNFTQYQRWLDASGLGQVLRTDALQFKKDSTELELLLVMRTADVDSAVALWKTLQRTYPRQSTAFPGVEDALFETFARKMQIPRAQGNVQIYVRDKKGAYIPCFYVWIWDENGEIKTEERLNMCKAKTFDVEVATPKLKARGSRQEAQSARAVPASRVFEEVLAFARELYEPKRCYDRNPKVEVDIQKTKSSTLVFTATDLCQTVLRDEQKSYWCKAAEALGWQCNDMRRERLVFTFDYIPTDSGYRLRCNLQGLFGSGYYVPRTAGYIDMEPDFDDYLTEYTNQFQQKLQERLAKLRP